MQPHHKSENVYNVRMRKLHDASANGNVHFSSNRTKGRKSYLIGRKYMVRDERTKGRKDESQLVDKDKTISHYCLSLE